jgi:hypothetical protein
VLATESQVAPLKSAEHRRGVVLATESQVAPLKSAEHRRGVKLAAESQVAPLESAEHRGGVVLATESQVASLRSAVPAEEALYVIVGTVQHRYERVSIYPDVENALYSDSVNFLICDTVHPVGIICGSDACVDQG